jgi:hypothetical protein
MRSHKIGLKPCGLRPEWCLRVSSRLEQHHGANYSAEMQSFCDVRSAIIMGTVQAVETSVDEVVRTFTDIFVR